MTAFDTADRFVLTPREIRRLVSACKEYELGQDEIVEVWRGETGALNAEGLLMRVQVSGADERFEVVGPVACEGDGEWCWIACPHDPPCQPKGDSPHG